MNRTDVNVLLDLYTESEIQLVYNTCTDLQRDAIFMESGVEPNDIPVDVCISENKTISIWMPNRFQYYTEEEKSNYFYECMTPEFLSILNGIHITQESYIQKSIEAGDMESVHDYYTTALMECDQLLLQHVGDGTEMVYQESFSSVMKNCLEFIRKIFRIIAGILKAILSFLKNRNIKQTVDQILEAIVPDAGSGNKDKTAKKHIVLPSDQRSTVKPPSMTVKKKPIKISFDKNQEISFASVNEYKDNGNIKHQNVPDKVTIVDSMLLIVNNNVQNNFFDAYDSLFLIFNEEKYLNIPKMIKEKFYKFEKSKIGLSIKSIKCSYKAIESFQKRFNELYIKLKEFENIDRNINLEELGITWINGKFNMLKRYAMSLNAFSGLLSGINIIDMDKENTIYNLEDLDKFVNGMIKIGIPSKFIMFNAYYVSSSKLKGDDSHDHPIWGQTRVVFFPPADTSSVYKIALSGYGIYSNYSETEISKKFREIGEGDKLALIKKSMNTQSIITQERVKPSNSKKEFDPTELNIIAEEHNLPIRFDDLHFDNIGIKNNKPVPFDYGNNQRIQ